MIGRESRADTDSSAAGNFSARVSNHRNLQVIEVSSYIFDWCISRHFELSQKFYIDTYVLFYFGRFRQILLQLSITGEGQKELRLCRTAIPGDSYLLYLFGKSPVDWIEERQKRQYECSRQVGLVVLFALFGHVALMAPSFAYKGAFLDCHLSSSHFHVSVSTPSPP